MTKKIFILFIVSIYNCVLLCQLSCKSEELRYSENILVVLAHPDDETFISGTLAKLADRGYSVTVTFITSGDDGNDLSGRGLTGFGLAQEREKEAQISSNALGINNPPIFLNYPDSYVKDHVYEIKDALLKVFKKLKPILVIGFGPDGITDDWDHILTGVVTDHVFDITNSGKLLLHMAVSQKAKNIFQTRAPVANNAVDLRVDVSNYEKERINSIDAHRTQFPYFFRTKWKKSMHDVSVEEFIIARNRDAQQLIQDCFF